MYFFYIYFVIIIIMYLQEIFLFLNIFIGEGLIELIELLNRLSGKRLNIKKKDQTTTPQVLCSKDDNDIFLSLFIYVIT